MLDFPTEFAVSWLVNSVPCQDNTALDVYYIMNSNMLFMLYYMLVNKLINAQDSKWCILISCCLKEINVYIDRETESNSLAVLAKQLIYIFSILKILNHSVLDSLISLLWVRA